jgi:exodeoxyribonuclease VII large subunit
VSAVGHETDVTIADKVADRRALTPTEAATAVVPSREDLIQALNDSETRLRDGLWRRLDMARQRISDLADRRAFRQPLEKVRDAERTLDDWGERIRRAGERTLVRNRERADAAAQRLGSVNPLAVLARGFSLTRADGGGVVRDAASLRLGDRIRTRLANGEVVSRVEAIGNG